MDPELAKDVDPCIFVQGWACWLTFYSFPDILPCTPPAQPTPKLALLSRPSSMDHTGPGVWTDAVLSYLLVRYGVSWQDLRGLSKPLRIGEVLVLPITGESERLYLSRQRRHVVWRSTTFNERGKRCKKRKSVRMV